MKTLKLGPKPLTFFEEKKLIEMLEYYLGRIQSEETNQTSSPALWPAPQREGDIMKRFIEILKNNTFDISATIIMLATTAFMFWWVSGLGASS